MGKYSDFDLDLNQVKAAGSGVSPASDPTLGAICSAVSSYVSSRVVDSIVDSVIEKCTWSQVSCGCSASDMTACGNAAGKVELLRC